MDKFADYLTQKFLEWQMSTGKKKTIREFARYLGIKYTTLIGYLNGNHPPNSYNLEILAPVIGYEVFDVLGLPRPARGVGELKAAYDILSSEQREQLADQVDKLITDFLESQGFSKDMEAKNGTTHL